MPRPSESSIFFLVFISLLLCPASAVPRKLAALVKEPPLVLRYHAGPLLKGNVTLNLLWYGRFSPSQRAIVVDFLRSLSPTQHSRPLPPSVSSWWSTTDAYGHGGRRCSSWAARCSTEDALSETGKAGGGAAAINVVLTSADVTVEGFCMSRCGTHGEWHRESPFIWVGNSASQCPGQCAWPFHQPIYGPQTLPLVAPNGDVGADGMVINLASMVAATVTNPFKSERFLPGPKEAPLEAVSACPGIFGTGAYPGYPGKLMVDSASGSSYNANGVAGRRYLLPAMWDPRRSRCTPLV
ncbi:unnamed protein product [Spirodela intermedia]|uniref:Uncharacterized protein n=1 Tax=Spirodela intermedia TaxID=51605 RepID=A0A7I8J4L6_SPIIN|nr:unnamed protein product [Spirodela intermedia]CAA6665010.1 unnamed protein product [Spirodela intermedia]